MTPRADLPRVHLVGTGLIGASLGIALTRAGYAVTLQDASPTSAALARDLGAGELADQVPEDTEVMVVATPPDVTPQVLLAALASHPTATVTDVSSVKGSILAALREAGADLSRYVGSHPMAGRERSGAVSARADLFHGRAWVLCATEQTDPRRTALVSSLAQAVGAAVTELPPGEHDSAVAAVSHVPQLAASVVAARLEELPDSAVALAGQGLRDVTRIAASDPQLWTQILAGNATAVGEVLDGVIADLTAVREALSTLGSGADLTAVGSRGVLARTIASGNAGHARIPGKHGAAPTAYAVVEVLVPDEPGQLARLLADVEAAGVNLEEIRLDHGLGQPFGLAEVSVVPAAEAPLRAALSERAWRLHD